MKIGQTKDSTSSGTTWMIVGLGNPGDHYAHTRHNIGQEAVDELAHRASVTFKYARKFNADIAVVTTLDQEGQKLRVVLLKPLSYMNLSGTPVMDAAKYYNVQPDHMIVFHDELDLPFGALRLKISGSDGGHNGLKDITRVSKTSDYNRVRIGIGRPVTRQKTADYVVGQFTSNEKKEIPFIVDRTCDAAELIIQEGLLSAQNKYNNHK